jgi:hypothetical protein
MRETPTKNKIHPVSLFENRSMRQPFFSGSSKRDDTFWNDICPSVFFGFFNNLFISI